MIKTEDAMTKKHKGCIYILTNPSFDEYVKIGYATDVEKRVNELNHSTSVPYSFRLFAYYEVDNELTDKELHKLIDKLNPDLRTIENYKGKIRKREFYAMKREDAYSLLESIAKISGTEKRLHHAKADEKQRNEEKEALSIEENSHRGPFTFSMCNIPIGSKIVYVRDPSVVATVVDDKHVLYKSETTSLTALATNLMHRTHGVQGPLYFTYKGKILHNICLEKEK